MASGAHRGDAILISDDDTQAVAKGGRKSSSRHDQHARPSDAQGRRGFPKAQLPFSEKDRVDIAYRRSSPGNLSSGPFQHSVSASGPSDAQDRRDKRSADAKEHDDPCPYYYDAVLDLKMYRGPGFRQFHPVVGSMIGHKEICGEWDARQLKGKNGNDQPRALFHPCSGTSVGDSASTDATTNQMSESTSKGSHGFIHRNREQEQRCLEEVLMVFPQVQHDFVRKLFRERQPGSLASARQSQAADGHVAGAIIAEIAEMESIPKQKDLKRKQSPVARDNDDVTITWEKSVLKNEVYFKEALKLLADEFCKVPTHFINKMLRERGTLYDCYHFLAECEEMYNNEPRKPYSRSRFGRVALEKKYQKTALEQRETNQYVSIVNEFHAAKQQRCREETRQKRQKADEEAEANNFTMHQLQGSLVDCQCCFDEAPINRAVHCEGDQTHFFCNKCINTRANEQIGFLRHDMSCMDTSGCEAEISTEALARALPVKISDKLAELKQLAEIKAAGLDGLEQCPFCDYQAVCAPVDVDTLFECLNPNCERVSCRKCKENSHVPRTCEEAKKDKGLSARHAVEEARSEAMIRSCPRCKVKIIKSAGCNKMTCSNCSAVMCYVCKKDITGRNYEHFGTSTTACPLQDRLTDDRHQQEADEAEKAAIAAAKAQDGDVVEEDLRIEAHLNQRPGSEVGVAHDARLRPLGQLEATVAGQFPFHAFGHPQFLAGSDRAGQPAAQHTLQFERFNHLVEEAHQQHDRVRGMLEEHQRHLQMLHPFLPRPNVHPLGGPVRLREMANPPFLHAHHYPEHGNTGLPATGAPVHQPWDLFNIGATHGLTAAVDDFVQREMGQVQRDFGVNNHNDQNNQFRLNGDALPVQIRQTLFNHGANNPMKPAPLHNTPHPRGNRFAQAQQQDQHVQGTISNVAIGH